ASHGGKGGCCQNVLGSRRSGGSRSNGSDMRNSQSWQRHNKRGNRMLVGYVSDESYAALADAAIEFRGPGRLWPVVPAWRTGAVQAGLLPGEYEGCLTRPGYGSKRVRANLGTGGPIHFRLLSDRLLGYAWPKWCRGGDRVEFRVHAVEPYKLGLWRY